jgi:putative FmdB family regulatory protein
MPIYEYKCENCGAMNEFIVFSSDEQLECKTCRSANLKKLMSIHNAPGSSDSFPDYAGGCCGSPNTCGTPGSCCGK